MAWTPSSTQADPPLDGGGAPAVAEDLLADLEEAIGRLVRQAARDPRDAEPSAPASDRSTEAPTLNPTEIRGPIAHEPRSCRKPGILACVAIIVCLGGAAIPVWRATAPPAIRTSVPPSAQAASRDVPRVVSTAQPATAAGSDARAAAAARQRIETTARDLADLRQTVHQLAAGQEQLTRQMRKLQAEKTALSHPADAPPAAKPHKRMPRRVSAPPAPRAAARKPAAMTPVPRQAARPASMTSGPSPPPRPAAQIQSEAQLSQPPPMRPPMPVPQP